MQTKFSIFLIVSLMIFTSYNCLSQTIFKGLNIDNSTFLLGATNARKSQCLYKPNDFNTIPNNGDITKIYYRYGTSGITSAHDLSPFTIKMGQTTDTIFAANNTFYNALTTVRYDSIYTIAAGTQGDWFGIDLQTPFTYDSSKTLIVEIKFYNSTGTAFGTLGSDNNDQKIISSDTASLIAVGSSTTWQDFGFDYLNPTGKNSTSTNKEVMVFPNPTLGIINIYNLNFKEDGILNLFDAYGKLVFSKKYSHHKINEIVDITALEQGLYLLKIETKNQSINKRIVKY
jgi:hypothetical protein